MNAQHLTQSLQAASELALARAVQSQAAATAMFKNLACGVSNDAPQALQALHLSAYQAMTLAQVGAGTGQIASERARDVFEAAMACQARALQLEQLHRRNELAPSQLYFDDVLPPLQQLLEPPPDSPPVAAPRPTSLKP